MHFYERIKQKFVYIYLFVLARRFYCFLKNFPNVGYDILERGYRYIIQNNSICETSMFIKSQPYKFKTYMSFNL